MKTKSIDYLMGSCLRFREWLRATLLNPSLQRVGLLLLGTAILTGGMTLESQAYVNAGGSISFSGGGASGSGYYGTPDVQTEKIEAATCMLLGLLEGAFGSLIMVAAGLGAILGSAFGQYRAALSCLIVAVGSFILRSIVDTFFPDALAQCGG